jgi:hypothetical protein
MIIEDSQGHHLVIVGLIRKGVLNGRMGLRGSMHWHVQSMYMLLGLLRCNVHDALGWKAVGLFLALSDPARLNCHLFSRSSNLIPQVKEQMFHTLKPQIDMLSPHIYEMFTGGLASEKSQESEYLPKSTERARISQS